MADVIQHSPSAFENTRVENIRDGERRRVNRIIETLNRYPDVRTLPFIQHSPKAFSVYSSERTDRDERITQHIECVLNQYDSFAETRSLAKPKRSYNLNKKETHRKSRVSSLKASSSLASITAILNKMNAENVDSMVQQFRQNVIMYPPHEVAQRVFEHSTINFEFSHLYFQLLDVETKRLQPVLHDEVQGRIDSKRYTVVEGEEPSDNQRIAKNTLLVIYELSKRNIITMMKQDEFVQWMHQLLRESLDNEWYQNASIRCDVLMYLKRDGHTLNIVPIKNTYSPPYRVYFKLLDLCEIN